MYGTIDYLAGLEAKSRQTWSESVGKMSDDYRRRFETLEGSEKYQAMLDYAQGCGTDWVKNVLIPALKSGEVLYDMHYNPMPMSMERKLRKAYQSVVAIIEKTIGNPSKNPRVQKAIQHFNSVASEFPTKINYYEVNGYFCSGTMHLASQSSD